MNAPNKEFSFRFDVDTPRCIKYSLLLDDLLSNHDIKATFFINFGKAASLKEYLSKLLTIGGKQKTNKLSNLKKLGLADFIFTAAFNPYVGCNNFDIVKKLAESGHEIGLHGGSNHALWQTKAHSWSQNELKKEIQWGMKNYSSCLGFAPQGFASPGWNHPDLLDDLLMQLGFDYSADIHANSPININKVTADSNLRAVPTNLTGEPGGIGYLEYQLARGYTNDKILDKFEGEVQNYTTVILYDHPALLGQNLDILEQMIFILQKLDFQFYTMEELVKRHI